MAGRILNRRELRKQADQAEQQPQAADTAGPAAVVVPKAKAAPRAKKPRKVKAPPRLRARWGVFDGSMNQIAVFDYNQRAAADEKLADLLARKKGIHFLQIVKEPMLELVPAEAAETE
jgi:hypothetical protein